MRSLTFVLHQLSKLRLLLYKYKFFKTHSFNVPIISVGNIEHGGTGKTPMVAWLVKELEQKNKKTCVVTRGYGRSTNKTIVVDGKKNYAVSEIGDEPFALLKENPSLLMVISNNKIEAINMAIDRLKVDVIILDDGFQSVYIRRDLDIVMVNLHHDWMHCVDTREPLESLSRADVIVLKPSSPVGGGNPQIFEDSGEGLKRFMGCPAIKIISNSNINGVLFLRAHVVWSVLNKNDVIDQTILSHVIAVCGIAHPASFVHSLKMKNIIVREFLVYKDHYNYSNDDMEHIYKKMKCGEEDGCKSIITTTKDYYKLVELNKKNVGIIKLKMEFDFINYGDKKPDGLPYGLSPKSDLMDLLDNVMSRVS